MCGHKCRRKTRLHSSRMRTGRVLTVSPSMLCTGGGVSAPGGVYLVPGGCTWSQRGGSLLPGGVCSKGGCLLPGGCTWSWGDVLPGGCLLWGVYLVPGVCVCSQGGFCSWGVYLVPGGCTWSWRVSAPEGGGGLLPGGCVRYSLPCEQNDKQVQKYYLALNFVCGR